MSVKAPVQEAPAKKELKCKRCGQCCSQMILPVSPLRLKRKYLSWKLWYRKTIRKKEYQKNHNTLRDVWLVYPMLVFIREAPEFEEQTQSGDVKSERKYMYRCKNLEMENGVATCTIHDIKPYLCSCYGEIPAIESKKGFNSYYPNCVWLS